jgi:colanic acid biosynthesis glycosyl transferase WcaI
MLENSLKDKAKKKVIFVNRFFYPDHSATSQILSDLAFHLAGEGWHVNVVTSRQQYDNPVALLPEKESVHGVTVHRINTTKFGRNALLGRALDYLSFYLAAACKLIEISDRNAIIVAKTDPPLISIVCMIVARLRGAILVNWLQDVFPEVAMELGVGVRRGLLSSLLIKMRNISLRGASQNVAIGEVMRGRLERDYGLADNVAVIGNWSDDDSIRPVERGDNQLRAQWGLSDKFVVGYSGNLGRAHDVSTIVAAAAELSLRSNIVFVIIGGGKQFQELEEKIRDRNLTNVVFHPYQPRDKLSLSLGVADLHLVVLQPGLEGLIVPSKFYGVAAAGRPVAFIGSASGEIACLIDRMKCGASFEIGDGEGLADYICALSEDIDGASRLGRNARAGLERWCSKSRALGAWSNLLTQMAGKTK